ncbi:MAG: hypothetical protein IIC24_05970, partial [Chloroflexi bacterium]|nr:hypothetical protein [Chloroflexota bacterium]
MQQRMEIELDVLIAKLPPHVQEPLRQREDTDQLLEVVLDLGRYPEARFLDSNVFLNEQEVTQDEIQYTIERSGKFGEANRAGIERTLHRVSAIRNPT